MSRTFELTGMQKAVQEAGLLYVKTTKQVVRDGKYGHRRIWVTGDMWSSISMLQNVQQVGSKITVTVGINTGRLGKNRKNVQANYAKLVHEGTRKMTKRPYFQWAWDGASKEINKVIMDAIDVKVNNKWEA